MFIKIGVFIMIKFTCKKEDMTQAINIVSKAVSPKSTITALEGIKLRLEPGKLELTGYDLEIGITTFIDCESEDSGEFILNSHMFSETTKRLPSEYVTYSIDENLNLTITGGNAEYKISALGAEEYPALPDIERDDPLVIPQGLLRSMINQSVYAVSTNDAKPIMTGELFDIREGIAHIVAIDGYRLAIRNEKIDFNGERKMVVPSKMLKEASAIMTEDNDKNCNIYVTRKHILFDINGFMIFTRLLEGEFHSYERSIPTEHITEISLKTSDLTHCLERCSLLLNEKNKAPVVLRLENGCIKLECKTAIGSLEDSIPADITGENIVIGFNNKYLLEALRAADTDKIKIHLNGANKAAKIVPPEGDHFIFIVMPIQIRG